MKHDEVAQIVANGKKREIRSDMTVATFLSSLGLDPARTVVELDGEPLERGRFGETILQAGSRIEIAQMVGGG